MIKAVKTSHENLTKKIIATTEIATFLALLLTLNNFIFKSNHFLQINSCAVGNICAKYYTNIFMGHFERKYIHPLIEGKSLPYFMYINYIFLICTGTKNELVQKFK